MLFRSGGVAVAICEVPVNEHRFKTRTDDVGENALNHHEHVVGATRVERRRRHRHPARAALNSLHGRTVNDGWGNIAQHDDVKRAGGTVAEIVLDEASDSVRADRERRSGWWETNQVRDDAGTGVAHDWQRVNDICEARTRCGIKTRLHDDVGRTDERETIAGISQSAELDSLKAKIHDAARLTDPLRGHGRPIGRNEGAEDEYVGATSVRPTCRAIEHPIGTIAGNSLVRRTDKSEAIGTRADIEHKIAASKCVESWKICQSECDWCIGCDERPWRGSLRASITRRTDWRIPTVRDHETQIRNRSRAVQSVQHGLSRETRAIQKLSFSR